MDYKVVIFGVKDTTGEIVSFVQENICAVDLVVTIHPDVLSGNEVSGYQGDVYKRQAYSRVISYFHPTLRFPLPAIPSVMKKERRYSSIRKRIPGIWIRRR